MAATLVPAKTAAGQAELDRRQRALTQRHRTVLFLIDGRRSADEVKDLAERAGAPMSCFDELLSMGLIELAPASPPRRPAAPVSGPTPLDSRTDSSFLPSARSLLPESTLSGSLYDSISPPDSLLRDLDGEVDAGLEEARRILLRAVRAEAPVAGSLTMMRLKRAKSRGDLLALLPEVEARISRPLHRLTAAQTLRHVRGLLVRAN
jgi:hypothetical protein